jgi:hypothetical protein
MAKGSFDKCRDLGSWEISGKFSSCLIWYAEFITEAVSNPLMVNFLSNPSWSDEVAAYAIQSTLFTTKRWQHRC